MRKGLRALGLSWAFIRDPACLIGFVLSIALLASKAIKRPFADFLMCFGSPGRGIGFCPTRTIRSVDIQNPASVVQRKSTLTVDPLALNWTHSPQNLIC
jgi:hypothetical protein